MQSDRATGNAEPSVDIVIAARNEAQDLGACLHSLNRLRYAGCVTIWVVDNGSDDATTETGRALGARVLTSPGGVAAARNCGVKAGRGTLVAFLDAHCTVAQDWLSALVSRLQRTGAGAVQGKIDYRFNHPRVERLYKRFDSALAGERSAYAWIKTGNAIYRRDLLEAAGGFDPRLFSCEDVDLSWKVLLGGAPLAFTSDAHVWHLDRSSLWAALKRFFRHGYGAGELSLRFGLRSSPLRPEPRSLAASLYGLGYRLGRLLASQEAPRLHRQRRPHRWQDQNLMVISDQIVWWFREDEAVVLIDIERRHRWVLEGGAGLFWLLLSRGKTRLGTARIVARKCAVAEAKVLVDLDEFVSRLQQCQALSLLNLEVQA